MSDHLGYYEFIVLYEKDNWSVGYHPTHSATSGPTFIKARNGSGFYYSGMRVMESDDPTIPKDIREAYFFWCAMVVE